MPMSSGGGGESSEPRASDEDDTVKVSELVPRSLQSIVPILRLAEEIQEDSPRVAYLCRFLAFDKAHAMDPDCIGDEVRQFKTYLLIRLEKEEMETKRRLGSTDAQEIQLYFERYWKNHIEEGVRTRKPDEIASHYQTVSVLFEVLKTITQGKLPPEIAKYAKEIERNKTCLRYSVLPLYLSGPTLPVMDIPEIKAAVELLRRVQNLPKPKPSPNPVPKEIGEPIIHDLLDWLGQAFGFQKSNVENQKEHLILLLANTEMREGSNVHRGEAYDCMIHRNTMMHLMKKVFENYNSWCQYLDFKSNIKIPSNATTDQIELLYIALYLLIWGEASNVRFMPEYICYIFHHTANDLYDIVSNKREGSRVPPIQEEGSDDAFLQMVFQPMYNIIQKEAACSKNGTQSHSKWRNYDDLNEYCWSKNCFKIHGWPIDFRTIMETEVTH